MEDAGQLELSHIADKKENYMTSFRTLSRFSLLNKAYSYLTTHESHSRYRSTRYKNICHTEIYMQIFKAALFLIVKHKKYQKSMVRSCKGIHSATKRKELLLHLTTWINLKVIRLSKRRKNAKVYIV